MPITYAQIATAEAELGKVIEARDSIVAKGASAPAELTEAITEIGKSIIDAETAMLAARLAKLSDMPAAALSDLSQVLRLPGLTRQQRDEIVKSYELVAAARRYALLFDAVAAGAPHGTA